MMIWWWSRWWSWWWLERKRGSTWTRPNAGWHPLLTNISTLHKNHHNAGHPIPHQHHCYCANHHHHHCYHNDDFVNIDIFFVSWPSMGLLTPSPPAPVLEKVITQFWWFPLRLWWWWYDTVSKGESCSTKLLTLGGQEARQTLMLSASKVDFHLHSSSSISKAFRHPFQCRM